MGQKLFAETTAGALELTTPLVMAPLKHDRAGDTTVEVLERYAEYYAQRASAGLIITEGSQISAEARGYIQTPGIHTAAQAAAWRKVTDAVHAKGSKIVIQLWHVGRSTHAGFEPTATPEALTVGGIQRVIEDRVQAATYAKEAGFDGVELHVANGCLLEQLRMDRVNTRSDAYGGSAENRARLLFEVLDALATVWEPGRIAVRLAPFASVNDVFDSAPHGPFHPADRTTEHPWSGLIVPDQRRHRWRA
ncbi:hypothetical protein [Tritonibacter mobilis]|uniref:oxidoreductase n=1 Tax=Tritonibacter mobilis TaxID=379347 RepID=UPI003A5BE976